MVALLSKSNRPELIFFRGCDTKDKYLAPAAERHVRIACFTDDRHREGNLHRDEACLAILLFFLSGLRGGHV